MSDTAIAPAPYDSQQELLADLFEAHANGEVRSVAVVGNAPLAPSAARAAAIDAADLVIRMNTFEIDRTEPLVGRRTDVVIIHRGTRAGPATFENYRARIYLLAEPGRAYLEPEAVPAWWPPDLGIIPISNAEFTKPLRRLLRIDNGNPTWATTGTLSVYLMHRLFPLGSVLLTGTSLPKQQGKAATVFEHNWGSSTRVDDGHRLFAERRLLASWAGEGWLSVVD